MSDDRGRPAQGLAHGGGDQRGGGAARAAAGARSAAQAERLLEWAAAWPERTWAVEGADGDLAVDPARAFRDRACLLLDAWTSPDHQGQVIEVAGCPLAASVMAGAAALEGRRPWLGHITVMRAVPADPRALATGLLAIAPLLVPTSPRRPAPPVRCTSHRASNGRPSDQLAAFLGRAPRE